MLINLLHYIALTVFFILPQQRAAAKKQDKQMKGWVYYDLSGLWAFLNNLADIFTNIIFLLVPLLFLFYSSLAWCNRWN